MNLEALKKLCDAATPGPWRWLGHTIGGTPRVWTWTDEPSALEEEQELTGAKPGDLHHCEKTGVPAVISSASTGYGGENDISIGQEDAAFIAAARTYLPLLIEVAEALDKARNHVLFRGVFDDPNMCSTPGSLWGILKPGIDALKALESAP